MRLFAQLKPLCSGSGGACLLGFVGWPCTSLCPCASQTWEHSWEEGRSIFLEYSWLLFKLPSSPFPLNTLHDACKNRPELRPISSLLHGCSSEVRRITLRSITLPISYSLRKRNKDGMKGGENKLSERMICFKQKPSYWRDCWCVTIRQALCGGGLPLQKITCLCGSVPGGLEFGSSAEPTTESHLGVLPLECCFWNLQCVLMVFRLWFRTDQWAGLGKMMVWYFSPPFSCQFCSL